MLRNFVFLFLLIGLMSCGKDNLLKDYDEKSIDAIEVETRSGDGGCFELVYPIEVEMEDGTILTAESRENAKTQIKNWYELNPDSESKPSIVYPVELISEEGESISINTRAELKEYVKDCKMNHKPRGKRCFKFVYPLTIDFPDGSSQEVNSGAEFKMALRAWKEDHQGEGKPTLSFPLTVELKEDGSLITVNSWEELKTLKKDCKG